MSTLSRTNSHSRKPQYKDYVSFLDNYKNGKKDEQNRLVTSDSGVNFSLTNSSNNSSCSVFSDTSDNFGSRKDSTATTETSKSKQPVKTEVFIEIKNPAPVQKFATQVFEVHTVNRPQESSISVCNTAKMFEQCNISDAHPLQTKHSFSKKQFGDGSLAPNIPKTPPKRSASIGEVSKIFENNSNKNVSLPKVKNFNAVPKPFHAASVPKLPIEVKASAIPLKPAILSPKPVISAPQFPKFAQDNSKPQADNVDSAFSSLSVSPSPPQSVSPPPPPIMPSFSDGVCSPPPPPPPLPPSNTSFKPPSFAKAALTQNGTTKANLATNGSGVRLSQNGLGSPQPIRNGIKVQTNDPSHQNGGSLNRNDPRLKKAVYGALRSMYGAYHDQANDYLATLPKNRVRKNNGLDSIINSIASQGGLEKLNGRANPNPEME